MDDNFTKVFGGLRGQAGLAETDEQRAARVAHTHHDIILNTFALCGFDGYEELPSLLKGLVFEYSQHPSAWHSNDRDHILFANCLASHIALHLDQKPKRVFQALWGKEIQTARVSNGENQLHSRVQDLLPYSLGLDSKEWFSAILYTFYEYCLEGYPHRGDLVHFRAGLRKELIEAVQRRRHSHSKAAH